MELPEFHVFQRNARTSGHAQTVARVDESICGGCKNSACAASGQQHSLGVQDVQIACFHFEGGDADDIAFRVANKVKGHPLYKEAGFGLDVLLVQSVQHGVTRTVSGSASTLNWFFTVVGGVAAKRTLVNGAVRVAVKRHAHVLKVVHNLGRFAAHEFNGVLVAEPVGTLDGVVEVVVPVVIGHVAQ